MREILESGRVQAVEARGPVVSVGFVDYHYSIGKYEVTAPAVCGISKCRCEKPIRMGCITWICGRMIEAAKSIAAVLSGSYSYTVATDWADRPVNYVSWGDAARFANWMHNGRGSGSTEGRFV